MVEEVLRQGFALAHRRLALIFIDLLWKVLWFGGTVAALTLVVVWFGSQLQSIAWQDTGAPGVNGLIAYNLLREFWNAYRPQVYATVAAVLMLSLTAWLILQALFHARI